MTEELSCPPSALETFFRILRKGCLQSAESRFFAYALFAAVYVIPTVLLAREKLLWDDECFTLYLSKTANWSELLRALNTGADQHPPTFYYLTHTIFALAGTSIVTLRLTALLGFGLSCVCMCEIARRLIGRRWGLPSMLAPLATTCYYYAAEARGYGLELGFATFSLLMWLLADEGEKRPWTVPALAVGLCLAVSSHYYAILFVLPLAAGEFFKWRLRRSIDIPVFCALLGALIPVLVFAPLIVRAKAYSTHFWGVANWGSVLKWYPIMVGRLPFILLAVAFLTLLLRIPPRDDPERSPHQIPFHVSVALGMCALLPMLGTIIAKLITHAFAERYFIEALPGIVILLIWGLKRVLRDDSAGPALVSACCLVLFAAEWLGLHNAQLSEIRRVRSVATLLRHSGNGPIILSGSMLMHQLSFYTRRDLASRLVYAADPHLAVQYLGHDTIDRGLLSLAPWFPLRIVWWHDWWQAHSYSLIYGYEDEWSWSTFAATDIGRVELLKRDVDRTLIAVTRTQVPEDDRTPADPSGKPSLYDRLPSGGPSLCNVYFPSDSCPVIDDPNFTAPMMSYPDRVKNR